MTRSQRENRYTWLLKNGLMKRDGTTFMLLWPGLRSRRFDRQLEIVPVDIDLA
jgi:hypothetical protein